MERQKSEEFEELQNKMRKVASILDVEVTEAPPTPSRSERFDVEVTEASPTPPRRERDDSFADAD